MSTLDPITLGVVQSGLQQVCNEMDLAFVRSAFSPVISEGLDRSDGIYAREDGKLIAQGELGLPVFVGTMQFSTEHLIATKPEVREGDIFAVNDPYLGGTHLMDVRFALPFFYKGAHFAWLSNTGHWPDTGGMVPGGFSARATEVVQEGLRFPPVKLYKEGTIDEEILSIILSNIRVPEQRIGDIEAQSAALLVGARRMTALLDKYGVALVEDVIREMRGRAARQMRAKIETIPDGTYRGLAQVDSDGVVNEPLTIDMRIRVEGSELYFDMSRSSPPCAGPMNSVAATTKSSIYLAIRHVFPDVPINAGMFEPLHITEPRGTFLHAEYPRPVSGCAAEVSQRIAEAVFDALAQAIPDRLFAAPAGTSGNFAVGGADPARGRDFVMYLFTGGGYGGSPSGDGLTNGCSTIGISKMQPIEVMEQKYPVLFQEYSLHEGSGGAGRWRGGFGVTYACQLRRGAASASMVMDHGRTGPNGALGGAPGGVNTVDVIRADGSRYRPPHLSKDQEIPLRPGDTVRVSTPGGGGYGDAFAREPALVLQDVMRDYYTAEEAEQRFGVVLSGDPLQVDEAATAARRQRWALRQRRLIPAAALAHEHPFVALAQRRLEELAGGRAGDLVHEDVVVRQPPLGEAGGEVALERVRVRLRAFLQDDDGERAFVPLLVPRGDDRGLAHGRMAHERVLEIDRADPLAAGLDQVLGAVRDLHVALGVDGGDVAGAQPAVVGPLVAELVGIVIGGGDPGAPRLHLAHGLAVPGHDALVVHQPHVDEGERGPLLRAVAVFRVLVQPLHGRLEQRRGAERRHLGHAPGVDGADAVAVEAPDHRLACRRAADRGAEPRVETTSAPALPPAPGECRSRSSARRRRTRPARPRRGREGSPGRDGGRAGRCGRRPRRRRRAAPRRWRGTSAPPA